MSDNIPFEIQAEIIKCLPVKSLLRFRSVSKTWKSLIDSSDFITHYSSQQQHLLVSYDDAVTYEQKYVSITDDDTFPQNQIHITLPEPVKDHTVIGYSNGLLCLLVDGSFDGTIVLWNISMRKGIDIVVPNVGHGIHTTIIGFGVCGETSDLKIVKIRRMYFMDIDMITSIPGQVEVFTLSTRAWRSPHRNFPRRSIQFDDLYVVVDGILYWLATDWIMYDFNFKLIISFDLTSEEFREITLPHSLTHNGMNMSKLRESVVVLEVDLGANNQVFNVWKMEGGVSKWFTKLFTLNFNTPYATVKGFRKSGELLVEIAGLEYDPELALLCVYEPYSKQMNDLDIDGIENRFSVYPYIETLVLLDQPDLTDYKNI